MTKNFLSSLKRKSSNITANVFTKVQQQTVVVRTATATNKSSSNDMTATETPTTPVLATPEMAAYCFQVLHDHLTDSPPTMPPKTIPNEASPIFVCFKKLDGELRGCIGNFAPQPLHNHLKEYTLQSALRDGRFNPISLKEIQKLQCTVSLLHSFEPARNWRDWEVGRHGIEIFFDTTGRRMKGTFLPRVAAEQEWDHKTTMEHLVRKAGFQGRVTEDLLQRVEITRYQDSEASATYEDFLKFTAQWK